MIHPNPIHQDDELVGSADLEVILGRPVFDRLRRHSHWEDHADLRGRWIDAGRRGRALQVRAGDVPLAELSDLDGDRRVDAVLVRTGRR